MTSVAFVLDQYKDIFDTKLSYDLSSLEKRYIWFTKTFYEFKAKYFNIYPRHWGVLCYIVNEFCCEISIYVA